MRPGKDLLALATEIDRRRKAKKDLLAPTARVEMNDNGQVVVGDIKAEVNAVAHDQIGQYCNIPAKYYDVMRDKAPQLLAANVNHWMKSKHEKRMLRLLDGKLRAFMSDKYRPLENEDLAEATLPVVQDLGLDVVSSEITDRRFYLKLVDRAVTRELAKKGAHFGDQSHTIIKMRVASPALVISNSEVGHGALSVLAGLYDGFCSNLAWFNERSMRKYHTGARHSMAEGEDVYSLLSTEAREATDRALWMQIRDVVKAAFDRAKFDALVDKVQGTQTNHIDGDPVEVVNLAAKKFSLTQDEGKSVLRHLIEGADLSQFGLYNAVTRASADVEDYDRASDLERLGGQIIELAPTEWRELAKAA